MEDNPITKAYTKAVLSPMYKKIEQLEDENKKLKKENQAYKGMWWKSKKVIECLSLNKEYLLQEFGRIEQKYLKE